MKKLKFRVWDKRRKVMFSDNDDVVVDLSGRIWETAVGDFEGGGSWLKDCVVMQFTGLKDKNGKEIYEGDILKWTNEFPALGEPKEIVRKVKWDTYYGAGWNFGESWKDGEKRWSYRKPQPEEIEVIGNIYENPELLK